jgi:type II secretory pathway pseudopilin PulG
MLNKRSAFTLLEILVITLLLGVVMGAASMVFISGQNLFATTSAQSDLQAGVIRALSRISFELQNSGHDATNVLKVSVLDNAGEGASDVLRFSIPLCVCGISPIDSNGEVSSWGAPLLWGQDGCGDATYTVGNNGKVDICHIPPGNAQNSHTLNVSPNAIKAHLAHGDYIGACGSCDPAAYTNNWIEYRIDVNKRLLRRVLNSSYSVLNSAVIAEKITGFQAMVNNDASMVTLLVTATGTGYRSRTLTATNAVDVLLRNR